MSQPVEDLVDALDLVPAFDRRAVDHEDRQLQRTRRVDLGSRSATPRVFRDDQSDPVLFEKGDVGVGVERAACDDDMVVGQGRWRGRWIDQAEQVEMFGPFRETGNLLAAYGEEDAERVGFQACNRMFDIRHVDPDIAFLRSPRRSGQRDQRDADDAAGLDGIVAHGLGERVGGIDDMSEASLGEVFGQTVGSAKAADSRRDGDRTRSRSASRVGVHGLDAKFGHAPCQSERLAGAAEDKEGRVFGHG